MMARMLRNLGEYVSGRIGNVVFVPDARLVKVSWKNDPNCKRPRLDDQLMAMGYKKEVFSHVENTGLYRKDLEGTFLVPDPLSETDATHLFLFWRSEDHQYSKSESFELIRVDRVRANLRVCPLPNP